MTVTAAVPLVEQPTDETPMWLFVLLVVANTLALALIVASGIVAIRREMARRKKRAASQASTPQEPDAPTEPLPALSGASA